MIKYSKKLSKNFEYGHDKITKEFPNLPAPVFI
jgi:hypothetical protein